MGSIKDEVAIIGMGCTQFGERWDAGTEDLAIEAAYEAYEDAGVVKEDIEDNLRSRTAQIHRLLNEAKQNLKNVPLVYLEVAVEMVEAAIGYFKDSLDNAALHALEDFKKFLINFPVSILMVRQESKAPSGQFQNEKGTV